MLPDTTVPGVSETRRSPVKNGSSNRSPNRESCIREGNIAIITYSFNVGEDRPPQTMAVAAGPRALPGSYP
ncbi:hypothetical protein GCM10008915_07690 [Bifidobacterium pullorum subsp. gallinarum]